MIVVRFRHDLFFRKCQLSHCNTKVVKFRRIRVLGWSSKFNQLLLRIIQRTCWNHCLLYPHRISLSWLIEQNYKFLVFFQIYNLVSIRKCCAKWIFVQNILRSICYGQTPQLCSDMTWELPSRALYVTAEINRNNK